MRNKSSSVRMILFSCRLILLFGLISHDHDWLISWLNLLKWVVLVLFLTFDCGAAWNIWCGVWNCTDYVCEWTCWFIVAEEISLEILYSELFFTSTYNFTFLINNKIEQINPFNTLKLILDQHFPYQYFSLFWYMVNIMRYANLSFLKFINKFRNRTGLKRAIPEQHLKKYDTQWPNISFRCINLFFQYLRCHINRWTEHSLCHINL